MKVQGTLWMWMRIQSSVCSVQYQTVTLRNSGQCILPLPVCNAQCKWKTACPHIPPCFLLSVLSLLIVNMNVIKLRHIKKSIQYLQLCSLKVSFLHAESWCYVRNQNLLCKKTRHNTDIVCSNTYQWEYNITFWTI